MPLFELKEEYQSLRTELLESRKWVFERPILVVTLCFAAFNYVKEPFSFFIPSVIIALLLFNLWFTINRLSSVARIVAYIHVVLENNNKEKWIGWESFLRRYRKVIKQMGEENVEKIIDEKIDKEAIPDAMMYYPPIYFFHSIIVILSLLASIYFIIVKFDEYRITSLIISAAFFIFYSITALKHKPDRMRRLIEQKIVICRAVINSY